MEKIEYLPMVNAAGTVIDRVPRSQCHCGGERPLHPVVHLHVIDPAGGLLLQKRSAAKLIQPGKWDTAVGGHVDYGESISEALAREAAEEIGLTDFEPECVTRYLWENAIERELVFTYIAKVGETFTPRVEAGESDALRFWPIPEIEEKISEDIFTPNFVHEYITLLKPYLQ